MMYKWVLPFILFILITLPLRSANILELEAPMQRYNLNPYMEVLEDTSGELGINDVTSPDYKDKFMPHKSKDPPSYSYTESAIWLRFRLKDAGEESKWFLKVRYPLLNQVDFYAPQESQSYYHWKAGNIYPFYDREVVHRNFIFTIPANFDNERAFYMRVKTDTAMIIPVILLEANKFVAMAQQEYLILGLYYGILLIIIFYILFLYVLARGKDYLYYAFYIIGIGLFQFVYDGLAFQFLWPNKPWWALNAINVFILVACFAVVVFTYKILPVKNYAPVLSNLLKIYGIIVACMIPLPLIIDFTMAMKLGIACVVISGVIILPSMVICWYREYRPAKYLLLGWVFLGIGAFIVSGRSLGIFPDTFITLNAIHIGFVIKIVFVSLGISDHVYILQKEKEHAEDRNKKLQLERQKLLHADTINELSREISVYDKITDIVKKLLLYIKKEVHYDYASYFEKRENDFSLLISNEKGSWIDESSGEGPCYTETVFDEVLKHRKPLIIPNINELNPLDNYDVSPDTSSAMIVPIVTSNKCLGVVALERINCDEYKELDASVVMNFTSPISVTIENAKLFEEIKLLSITDELTGLYNRRYLYERGNEEYKRARRYHLPMSLIMLDIDNFKEVNDNLGHGAGDEVLKTLTAQCNDILRGVDISCRYGGEEFVFILPETKLRDAKKVAERIRGTVASTPIYIDSRHTVWITVSMGVSALKQGIDSFEEMVNNADAALYEAKKRGKNKVIAEWD